MEPTTSKSNTENKKKISFNDDLEYFPTTIKDSQSEENDCNDKKIITNETHLLPVLDVTMNPKLTKDNDTFSKNVLNEREIEDTLDSKNLLNESSTEIGIENEEINEGEISLQIISDKVVLLMMSTGGVADKYTPAVRSMQEGNFFR